jgi:hypothetical protein
MKVSLAAVCLAASMIALTALAGLGATAEAAVGQVSISQTCSSTMPGTVKVTFTWSGGAPNSLQTWVDLSLANNAFQQGTFIGAGPFGASTNAYTWDGLVPNAVHYVRVNQLLPPGNWDPSQTFTFATMACPPAGFSGGESMTTSVGTNGTVSFEITAGMTPVVGASGPGIIVVSLP